VDNVVQESGVGIDELLCFFVDFVSVSDDISEMSKSNM